MKYKNKKIIFSMISLVMILTIVVSPLGSIISNAYGEDLVNGTVNHQTSSKWWFNTNLAIPSTFGISSSDLLTTSSSEANKPPFLVEGVHDSLINSAQTLITNDFNSSNSGNTWQIDVETMSPLIVYIPNNSKFAVVAFPKADDNNSCFFGYDDSGNNPHISFYIKKDYADSIHYFDYYYNYLCWINTGLTSLDGSSSQFISKSNSNVTIDDEVYYKADSFTTCFLCYTDIPVYYKNTITPISSMSDLGQNVNPNASGVSNLDDEIENHLLLGDNTKFYIANSSFNNGSLYLYPILDTTQLGQNESLDDYFFRITGTVQTTCTYNSGIKDYYASNSNGTKLVNHFPMSSGGGNSYNFTLQTSSGSYYDFPVTDASSGQWSMSLSDFNNMFYSSTDYTYYDMAYGLDSLYSGTNFWIDTSNAVSGQSIMGVQWFKRSSDVTVDVEPDHVIYNVNLSVYKKNRNTDEVSEGSIVSVISGDICDGGLSGENLNTSSTDSIKNALGTDYVPSGYDYGTSNTNYKDTYNNVGGSGGSSSSNIGETSVGSSNSNSNANIGDGAIVINNNPTFNNNPSASATGGNSSSDSSSGFGGFLSTLITLLAMGKTSSVNTISDITDASGYLDLANTMLGSVPIGFWTVLLTTFTACLGIMTIAFIIKLLMKIFLY